MALSDAVTRHRHVTIVVACQDCDWTLHGHYHMPYPAVKPSSTYSQSHMGMLHVRETGHTVIIHRKIRIEMKPA